MKKLFFSFLIASTCAFSQEIQKTETYKFGHNGMELIAKSKKGTVIISTFNAKIQIREDIAHKIYDLFLKNKIINNTIITINGEDAEVTGKCIIKKRANLTSVSFYYQRVDWCTGLIEISQKALADDN